MNKEIELKAHVYEPEAVKMRLESLYGAAEAVSKDDIYYIYRTEIDNGRGQPVRLRSENGRNVVTLKQKSVEHGIEVNNELEFGVDIPENFIKYLQLTGADEWLTKKKRGWKFTSDYDRKAAVIELCEITGLGWFLEIEIVLQDPDKQQIDGAEREILSILKKAGIPEDRIEPRYYSEMLGAE
ncbi:MAG: class IV adenylate cyclase [Spirochaetales bacterium]|uniref:Class IV adenylate cyclase n=1 Tax=Candidatus Thalassospirochaeta sargassi TaxID=3119039 RepID=A0AAJ1ML97_9SPIO|nr:class IV adenylate cyclase [Spirochaetales bacterium]